MYIYTGIIRLTTGLIILKENVYALYESMGILASHLVSPLVILPDELHILGKVKQDMKTDLRLELLDNLYKKHLCLLFCH